MVTPDINMRHLLVDNLTNPGFYAIHKEYDDLVVSSSIPSGTQCIVLHRYVHGFDSGMHIKCFDCTLLRESMKVDPDSTNQLFVLRTVTEFISRSKSSLVVNNLEIEQHGLRPSTADKLEYKEKCVPSNIPTYQTNPSLLPRSQLSQTSADQSDISQMGYGLPTTNKSCVPATDGMGKSASNRYGSD